MKLTDVLLLTTACSSCFGFLAAEQYALTEASYVVVKLLQRFDTLENADEGPDLDTRPVMNHTLTMAHANGVRVRLYSSSG